MRYGTMQYRQRTLCCCYAEGDDVLREQGIVQTWDVSAEGSAARLKPLTSNLNFLLVPSASCASNTRLDVVLAFHEKHVLIVRFGALSGPAVQMSHP